MVEGIIDEAIVRTLLGHTGHVAGTIYVQGGKSKLLSKLAGFNAAARFSPWLVLIDLNGDAPCAPEFVAAMLPNPSSQMVFRIAVRQAEAWLMGDTEQLASYLRVSRPRVPNDPEGEGDAKQTMVNIARNSRDRHIREDMVPTPASGRKTGPNYAGRLIEFATRRWRPEVAAGRVESLNRCLQRLATLPSGD
ncbi:MAG: hypothetical protein ACRDK7_11985 [Solirubrobacteraceae bacterium]